jgi:hypothetical protein
MLLLVAAFCTSVFISAIYYTRFYFSHSAKLPWGLPYTMA